MVARSTMSGLEAGGGGEEASDTQAVIVSSWDMPPRVVAAPGRTGATGRAGSYLGQEWLRSGARRQVPGNRSVAYTVIPRSGPRPTRSWDLHQLNIISF